MSARPVSKRRVAAALAALALACPARAGAVGAAEPAGPLLHPMFQDHGVLQRDMPVRVYGSAPAGSTVTVSIAGQSQQTTTSADGTWQATLEAIPAGGPYTLEARTDAQSDVNVDTAS